jgi:cytochrome c5
MRLERNVPGPGDTWPLRVAVAACLVLGLTACGGDKGGASAGAAPDSAAAADSSALAPGPSPALAAAISASEQATLAALPSGAGQALVKTNCLVCHSAAMIEQQHKDEAAWTKTVTQMMGWGSPLPADQKQELVTYLVANFGPRTGSPNAVPTAP